MEFAFMALSAFKVIGTVVGGAEQSAQLRAQERSERIAAMYSQQNAHTELQLAAADADAQRRRGAEIIGEQTAALGQSGFGLGASSGLVIEQSASNAELDAMNIQYKGILRSRANQIEMAQHIGQANAYKAARKAIPFKTVLGAATSLLTGAAQSPGLRIT